MTSVMSSKHNPQINDPIFNEKKVYKDLRLGLFDQYRTSKHWYDYSANKNHGTVNGAVISGQAPPYSSDDRGMYFDGIDDYIFIEPNTSLDVCEEISMGFWMKTDPIIPNMQFIISKFISESNASYEIYMSSVARFRLYDEIGGHSLDGYTNIKDGSYHHIVGTLENGTMYLYVDGSLEGFTNLPTEHIAPSSGNIFISTRSGIGYPFKGFLSDVFITGSCMSADDVNGLYQRTRVYYGV